MSEDELKEAHPVQGPSPDVLPDLIPHAPNSTPNSSAIPLSTEEKKPEVVDVAPPPAPTSPTPEQVPGPPPAQPEPTTPTVKAEATPEQIEEAKQYVMSKGYSAEGAAKIVAQYGALFILEGKSEQAGSTAQGGVQGQQTSDEPPVALPPGSVTVRVFDYDSRKPLHIMEQRDAGHEFDVYVRTR